MYSIQLSLEWKGLYTICTKGGRSRELSPNPSLLVLLLGSSLFCQHHKPHICFHCHNRYYHHHQRHHQYHLLNPPHTLNIFFITGNLEYMHGFNSIAFASVSSSPLPRPCVSQHFYRCSLTWKRLQTDFWQQFNVWCQFEYLCGYRRSFTDSEKKQN